jgi:hypothetical protein
MRIAQPAREYGIAIGVSRQAARERFAEKIRA